MNKTLKITLNVLKYLLLVLVSVAIIYFLYVVISTKRVGDTELPITFGDADYADKSLPLNTPLSAVTYNIGFGAYDTDFSFFMDGGESSRAQSPQTVYENLAGITGYLSHRNADVSLLQEVDVDGTRSHHIDLAEAILNTQQDKWSTFAINYDSAYLFYPFTEPHGKNRSGLLTLSRYPIREAHRTELPIEGFPSNLVDLDRCYSKNRIPTSDPERSLVIYNLHLSAYSSDGSITNEQIRTLLADMQTEYDNGNYVIAGGDFNRDLLAEPTDQVNEATWAQPFPANTLSVNFKIFAPENAPTCRDTATPYEPGKTKTYTLDGYIVSDNVQVTLCESADMGFTYSDHDPVRLEFILIK